MVRIRLKRMGTKKRPFYRIIAVDSRAPRNGRPIEELGYYNPMTEPPEIKLKEDRIEYFLKEGATASETVENILKKQGLPKV